MSRPGVIFRDDGEVLLTIPSALRWFYEMDDDDMAEMYPHARERVLRIKARVDAARIAFPDTEAAIARAFDLARMERRFAGLMARSPKHETDTSRCTVPGDGFWAIFDDELAKSGGSS